MLIVNVPIESLEERYSAQWNKWFDEYIGSHKIDNVKTIYPGPLRSTIKEGDFLDITSTVYFKSKQIAAITRKVDEGEIPRDQKVVFLIQDGWFPVEQLAYLRDMLGCHYWKFVGIFHAGTYSKWDLTARSHMYTWGEDLENSWFEIYDTVVVGSEHHRRTLMSKRKISGYKLHVIPWPVEVPDLDLGHKENIIVFPHRFGVEKQVHEFKNLSQVFFESNWRFKCTAEECKTKQEYYKLLAKSKIAISLGLEEFFGIAMVEATMLGCLPLVPDSFSYKEIYRKQYCYQGLDDLKYQLKAYMEVWEKHSPNINAFRGSWIDKPDFYTELFSLIGDL